MKYPCCRSCSYKSGGSRLICRKVIIDKSTKAIHDPKYNKNNASRKSFTEITIKIQNHLKASPNTKSIFRSTPTYLPQGILQPKKCKSEDKILKLLYLKRKNLKKCAVCCGYTKNTVKQHHYRKTKNGKQRICYYHDNSCSQVHENQSKILKTSFKTKLLRSTPSCNAICEFEKNNTSQTNIKNLIIYNSQGEHYYTKSKCKQENNKSNTEVLMTNYLYCNKTRKRHTSLLNNNHGITRCLSSEKKNQKIPLKKGIDLSVRKFKRNAKNKFQHKKGYTVVEKCVNWKTVAACSKLKCASITTLFKNKTLNENDINITRNKIINNIDFSENAHIVEIAFEHEQTDKWQSVKSPINQANESNEQTVGVMAHVDNSETLSKQKVVTDRTRQIGRNLADKSNEEHDSNNLLRVPKLGMFDKSSYIKKCLNSYKLSDKSVKSEQIDHKKKQSLVKRLMGQCLSTFHLLAKLKLNSPAQSNPYTSIIQIASENGQTKPAMTLNEVSNVPDFKYIKKSCFLKNKSLMSNKKVTKLSSKPESSKETNITTARSLPNKCKLGEIYQAKNVLENQLNVNFVTKLKPSIIKDTCDDKFRRIASKTVNIDSKGIVINNNYTQNGKSESKNISKVIEDFNTYNISYLTQCEKINDPFKTKPSELLNGTPTTSCTISSSLSHYLNRLKKQTRGNQRSVPRSLKIKDSKIMEYAHMVDTPLNLTAINDKGFDEHNSKHEFRKEYSLRQCNTQNGHFRPELNIKFSHDQATYITPDKLKCGTDNMWNISYSKESIVEQWHGNTQSSVSFLGEEKKPSEVKCVSNQFIDKSETGKYNRVNERRFTSSDSDNIKDASDFIYYIYTSISGKRDDNIIRLKRKKRRKKTYCDQLKTPFADSSNQFSLVSCVSERYRKGITRHTKRRLVGTRSTLVNCIEFHDNIGQARDEIQSTAALNKKARNPTRRRKKRQSSGIEEVLTPNYKLHQGSAVFRSRAEPQCRKYDEHDECSMGNTDFAGQNSFTVPGGSYLHSPKLKLVKDRPQWSFNQIEFYKDKRKIISAGQRSRKPCLHLVNLTQKYKHLSSVNNAKRDVYMFNLLNRTHSPWYFPNRSRSDNTELHLNSDQFLSCLKKNDNMRKSNKTYCGYHSKYIKRKWPVNNNTKKHLNEFKSNFFPISPQKCDPWLSATGMMPFLNKDFLAMAVKCEPEDCDDFRDKMLQMCASKKCRRVQNDKEIDNTSAAPRQAQKKGRSNQTFSGKSTAKNGASKKEQQQLTKNKRMGEDIVENDRSKGPTPFRQAVKVTSSFSFDLEFFKDRIPSDCLEPLPCINIIEIKPRKEIKTTRVQSKKKGPCLCVLETKKIGTCCPCYLKDVGTSNLQQVECYYKHAGTNTKPKKKKPVKKEVKAEAKIKPKDPIPECDQDECDKLRMLSISDRKLKDDSREEFMVKMNRILEGLRKYKFSGHKQSVQYGTKFSFGCEFFKDRQMPESTSDDEVEGKEKKSKSKLKNRKKHKPKQKPKKTKNKVVYNMYQTEYFRKRNGRSTYGRYYYNDANLKSPAQSSKAYIENIKMRPGNERSLYPDMYDMNAVMTKNNATFSEMTPIRNDYASERVHVENTPLSNTYHAENNNFKVTRWVGSGTRKRSMTLGSLRGFILDQITKHSTLKPRQYDPELDSKTFDIIDKNLNPENNIKHKNFKHTNIKLAFLMANKCKEKLELQRKIRKKKMAEVRAKHYDNILQQKMYAKEDAIENKRIRKRDKKAKHIHAQHCYPLDQRTYSVANEAQYASTSPMRVKDNIKQQKIYAKEDAVEYKRIRKGNKNKQIRTQHRYPLKDSTDFVADGAQYAITSPMRVKDNIKQQKIYAKEDAVENKRICKGDNKNAKQIKTQHRYHLEHSTDSKADGAQYAITSPMRVKSNIKQQKIYAKEDAIENKRIRKGDQIKAKQIRTQHRYHLEHSTDSKADGAQYAITSPMRVKSNIKQQKIYAKEDAIENKRIRKGDQIKAKQIRTQHRFPLEHSTDYVADGAQYAITSPMRVKDNIEQQKIYAKEDAIENKRIRKGDQIKAKQIRTQHRFPLEHSTDYVADGAQYAINSPMRVKDNIKQQKIYAKEDAVENKRIRKGDKIKAKHIRTQHRFPSEHSTDSVADGAQYAIINPMRVKNNTKQKIYAQQRYPLDHSTDSVADGAKYASKVNPKNNVLTHVDVLFDKVDKEQNLRNDHKHKDINQEKVEEKKKALYCYCCHCAKVKQMKCTRKPRQKQHDPELNSKTFNITDKKLNPRDEHHKIYQERKNILLRELPCFSNSTPKNFKKKYHYMREKDDKKQQQICATKNSVENKRIHKEDKKKAKQIKTQHLESLDDCTCNVADGAKYGIEVGCPANCLGTIHNPKNKVLTHGDMLANYDPCDKEEKELNLESEHEHKNINRDEMEERQNASCGPCCIAKLEQIISTPKPHATQKQHNPKLDSKSFYTLDMKLNPKDEHNKINQKQKNILLRELPCFSNSTPNNFKKKYHDMRVKDDIKQQQIRATKNADENKKNYKEDKKKVKQIKTQQDERKKARERKKRDEVASPLLLKYRFAKNTPKHIKKMDPAEVRNHPLYARYVIARTPCICGNNICKSKWMKVWLPPNVLKPCLCGSKVCEEESIRSIVEQQNLCKEGEKKLRKAYKEELKDQFKLQKRLRNKEIAEMRVKYYLMQQRIYARKDAAKNERIRKRDKKKAQKIKKQRYSLDRCTDSVPDIAQYAWEAAGRSFKRFYRFLHHPKNNVLAYWYLLTDRNIRKKMPRTKLFPKNGPFKALLKRVLTRFRYVIDLSWLQCARKKRYSKLKGKRTNITTIGKGKVKERLLKCDACDPFLISLRKKPCLWVFYSCPWFYPHCVLIVHYLKQIMYYFAVLLAAVVWTPCVVCASSCGALFCCFNNC